jgi:hypothetical protein
VLNVAFQTTKNCLLKQKKAESKVQTDHKLLKGDTAAIILDGVKIAQIQISRTFLSIESENVWPSAMATFAVLHVEKDDQVR